MTQLSSDHPSPFAVSVETTHASEPVAPRKWQGGATQSVTRLRHTRLIGYDPVFVRHGRAIEIDVLFRKRHGFWARWRKAGIVAHGTTRDEAVLRLLDRICESLIDLDNRATRSAAEQRRLEAMLGSLIIRREESRRHSPPTNKR